MPRLKRSDCSASGIGRRRAGKGFTYFDSDGNRVGEEAVLERIRELAIPPAWKEVWICPFDNGHIQATGIDDAGRKQYLYHAHWSHKASMKKFDEMLEFARRLPKLRKIVSRDIFLEGMPEERALACAIRMMDLGFFRIGSEQYAEKNETYGAATILRSHVTLTGKLGVRFEYSAKGSQERIQDISDRGLRAAAEELLRRRSGPGDFLVYRSGRKWIDVRSGDVNDYIRAHVGEGFSAKDFRTWNGTVLAAVELAASEMPETRRGRERVIRKAIEAVAERLGNTPAVSRSSYIDPRVLDRYRNGGVIQLPARGAALGTARGRLLIERRVRSLILNK